MEGWILNKWFLVGDTGPSWIFFRGGGYFLADNKVSFTFTARKHKCIGLYKFTAQNLKGYLCGDDFFVNVGPLYAINTPPIRQKEWLILKGVGRLATARAVTR